MTDIIPHGAANPPGRAVFSGQSSGMNKSAPALNGRETDAASRLKASCAEMESLFIYHMLEKMRATVEKSDLFGGGNSEEMYTSMLDSETAKNLAAAGGIGLAEILEKQLAMMRVKSID